MAIKPLVTWDVAALLLRLSLALVFIVGGLFVGMPNIKSFVPSGIVMTAIGLALLWGGSVGRYAAMAAGVTILFYVFSQVGYNKGLVGSLNAVKREIALFAVAIVLAVRDSGNLWTASDLLRRLREGIALAKTNASGHIAGPGNSA